MKQYITATFRNGPKWIRETHPTLLDFVSSFPEHDPNRVQTIMEFINTLSNVVADARPAMSALGDDDTVSWVETFTVMDTPSTTALDTVALLLEHLEMRKAGPFVKAHNYVVELTTGTCD